MPRLRLRTRFLLAMLLITAGLTLTSLFLVRRTGVLLIATTSRLVACQGSTGRPRPMEADKGPLTLDAMPASHEQSMKIPPGP